MATNNVINSPKVSFMAYATVDDANITGNGTSFRLGSATALTKQFDTSNSLNTNGIFTAPIGGYYYFSSQFYIANLTAAMIQGKTRIITTTSSFDFNEINPYGCSQSNSGNYILTLASSCVVRMNAGDTAYTSIIIYSGAGDTVALYAAASAQSVFFAGYMISGI